MAWTRLILALSIVTACGPSGARDHNGDAHQADAPCPTAITGKVFAPNGTMPLYNVMVYVPQQDPPPPFTPGVQCGQCTEGIPGGAITSATTDAEGKFRLDVPPGVDVPVIITTGKWRRRVLVAPVQKCADTPIADGTFRLPRNRSEGELPRIAVVTGGCDALGCILTKLGIDASEFGDSSASDKSVVWYNGNGGSAPGAPQSAQALWGNLSEMMKFDLLINTCECNEYNEGKTSPDLLRQYADMGGRVFGSHYHYTWMKNLIPAWTPTANWVGGSSTMPDLVDTTHAKGAALSQWLMANQASSVAGQISLGTKTYNASTVNGATTRWLYSSGTPATTHYLSFQTPVGAMPEAQCGKVVYAGMHVSSGSVSPSFPVGCNNSFTPDEKALVFLLFDLTACNQVIF